MPMSLARLVSTGSVAVPIAEEAAVANRVIKRVMVYMGFPGRREDPPGYARAQRQKQHWEHGHAGDVIVKQRTLKYPPQWTPASEEKPHEKGIDVMLAMDVVRGTIDSASECHFDLAILACADTDLIPVVEFVVDRLGADAVQTVAPENVVSDGRRLGQGPAPIRAAQTTSRPLTNRTALIRRQDFERVADRTDHNVARSARQPAPDGRRIPPNRRR
jgi:hypothetical protein